MVTKRNQFFKVSMRRIISIPSRVVMEGGGVVLMKGGGGGVVLEGGGGVVVLEGGVVLVKGGGGVVMLEGGVVLREWNGRWKSVGFRWIEWMLKKRLDGHNWAICGRM